ncbi:aminodeoxychorismate synthase component I [Amycolatopsis rhabdoformis]|uniref:Aminodeoxychorismate synthase component I n=1 Tax=Amycolatopsis rhabdoformis TaxID=1448059 RepID=A0ABZ1I7T0_9PSEU|nr:aminodeoxychorismate synthase component I [Amycolatopsis rhabdoformis]WSE29928.1 aminodeoxychorismate synthase component I [Amycolatopsis rhabdoformis]
MSEPESPVVRFDDFRAGSANPSFALRDPVAVLSAESPAEVAAVLVAAEEAARRGHWVAGFVGYEAAAGLDPLLPVAGRPADDPLARLPLAWFGVFARREQVALPSRPDAGVEGSWALDRGEEAYVGEVEAIRHGIAQGSFYQVNLTARLRGREPEPSARYALLAHRQRTEFSAFLRTGDHDVLSVSPELFFALDGRLITTRPMKGTARRGRTPEEDRLLRARLLASAKERAENVMIVDLLRNDLSRVAATGSVRVSELLVAEAYPTTWQLTSTVRATVRPEVGLLDLFRALFPSGSVTGAPKIAAMRAVAEIEGRPRGVYCGAIGFLRPGTEPSMRFSVGIRTLTVDRCSGYAEYGTGGGITWSSEARAEWDELWAKTEVLRDITAY